MKYLSLILIFTSFANILFSTELNFLSEDGTEYNRKDIPELMVTEYLKEQGKLIKNGAITKQWASYGKCQEVWRTEKFTIVCGTFGIWTYDQDNTRKIYFEPKMRPLEIHSCQPLEDGGMLIGVNKSLLELNAEGKIRRLIKIPFLKGKSRMQMKTVRKLANGGYIISACGQNKVYILNKASELVRTINLNKIELPIKANRIHGVSMLANGNVLIGTGYGKCLIEIDTNDKVVWSLKPQDLPSLGLNYVGGFVVRENGNIVVAAYNSDYPLFEVTRGKKLVWKLVRNKDLGLDLPTNVNMLAANL